MTLIHILNLIVISSFIIQTCDSTLITKNHNLSYNLPRRSLDHLCRKLSDPKFKKKCNIVSCIGANHWRQRQFLEKNFGLDPRKSSTLSGPLKPRNDLWEDDQPDGFNFLLDSEIPELVNELNSSVDAESLLKLSVLSNCILIYLNENDFEDTRDDLYLNKNVKTFFEKLSKKLDLELGGSKTKTKDIYIVLPDFSLFQKRFNLKKSQLKEFEKTLKDYFPNKTINVKNSDKKLVLPKYFNTTSSVNTNQLLEVLKSFKLNFTLASSMDYVKINSFKNFRKFIDESLGKALKGELMEDFATKYLSTLLDSRISFFTLVMELLGRNHPVSLVEFYGQQNALMCLQTMVKNLETQIKSDFLKYYAQHRKTLDINMVVDQFLHKYKTGLLNILPKTSHQEMMNSLESSSHYLRNYMYHIDEIFRNFPNNMDSVNESKTSKLKLKSRDKQFRGLLQLVAHIRDRGSGNRSAFLNYTLAPFMLTLGYSNDRNIIGDPTSGKMFPPVKIQPVLHLRWNL